MITGNIREIDEDGNMLEIQNPLAFPYTMDVNVKYDDSVYALDYYFYGPIRRLSEQLWAKIENLAVSDDEFYDKLPKYIRTELMFPKKKKRGTMRRRRRERKTE